MKDLKEKTIRGGVARLLAQAANFILRIASLMILARLLDPKDSGWSVWSRHLPAF